MLDSSVGVIRKSYLNVQNTWCSDQKLTCYLPHRGSKLSRSWIELWPQLRNRYKWWTHLSTVLTLTKSEEAYEQFRLRIMVAEPCTDISTSEYNVHVIRCASSSVVSSAIEIAVIHNKITRQSFRIWSTFGEKQLCNLCTDHEDNFWKNANCWFAY
jgi:hypothetical protein